MSTTPVVTEGAGAAVPSSRGRQRRILVVAGATLGVSIAVLIALLAISTASAGKVSVLIGALGSDGLAGLATVVALASVTVGLCVIPVSKPALVLLIPVRLIAIAATFLAAALWWLTAPVTVVPLVSAGCETGYVVEEESFLLSGRGTVYRTVGLLVTAVERTVGDDGYHPFADGAYAVVEKGDSLRVWYDAARDYEAAPVPTDGAPAFTLPKLDDRTLPCGVSTGARTPSPSPPSPPVYGADEIRRGVEGMLAASLTAAVGPVLDSAGNGIDPGQVPLVSTACGDNGSRVEVALDFKTTDNAASLEGILHAWDTAGYSPDRAIREDIRYSDVLPVQLMRVHNSTTVDGLIHMRISSQCAASE